MKKIIFCVTFFICTTLCYSQVKIVYPFEGRYNARSAQGMAIYKSSAFLLNDQGHCRIYDLKTKRLISDFDLASANKKNHANCASFGVEFTLDNKKYPVIYISECSGLCRCFVESIKKDGSKLIQTLQLVTKRKQSNFDWIIDRSNKFIYVVSTDFKTFDSAGVDIYSIIKLPLPSINSGDVVFTEKDIIDQFEISFPNVAQGGTIRKGYLYLPVGNTEIAEKKNPLKAKRAIIIVDLGKKKIKKIMNISDDVKDEPEDVDFYKGDLLLYCGQKGGLYKIKIK